MRVLDQRRWAFRRRRIHTFLFQCHKNCGSSVYHLFNLTGILHTPPQPTSWPGHAVRHKFTLTPPKRRCCCIKATTKCFMSLQRKVGVDKVPVGEAPLHSRHISPSPIQQDILRYIFSLTLPPPDSTMKIWSLGFCLMALLTLGKVIFKNVLQEKTAKTFYYCCRHFLCT